MKNLKAPKEFEVLYVVSAVILALAGVFYLCGDVEMAISVGTIGVVGALFAVVFTVVFADSVKR